MAGDLSGNVIAVTAATPGTADQPALHLADLAATAGPGGRDAGRLEKVRGALRERGSDAEPVQADFAAQAEVRRVAAELLDRHSRIAVLVNNAGVVSSSRKLSPDGRELTMAINHLAPFLL